MAAEDYIELDEHDTYVYAKQPLNIREFVPSVDLALPADHKFVNEHEQFIQEFKEYRTENVNGVLMEQDGFSCLRCDYCRHSIDTFTYFYCFTCHKDMCTLCHMETSEEIAIANGAKNFATRADVLLPCIREGSSHKVVERVITCNLECRSCDLCSQQYTENGTWFNKLDVDCCGGCYLTDKGRAFVEENDLKLAEGNTKYEHWKQTGFGSINDWTPIIKDDEGNMVLFNRNADLPVGYAFSSTDDHGRQGYFSLDTGLGWTIEKIVEKLNGYAADPEFLALEKNNGWDHFYNMPIKRIMSSLGMPIHYG